MKVYCQHKSWCCCGCVRACVCMCVCVCLACSNSNASLGFPLVMAERSKLFSVLLFPCCSPHPLSLWWPHTPEISLSLFPVSCISCFMYLFLSPLFSPVLVSHFFLIHSPFLCTCVSYISHIWFYFTLYNSFFSSSFFFIVSSCLPIQ